MADPDQRLILLVERDEEDVFLFRRLLHACSYSGAVRAVLNHRQATDYLNNAPPYSDKEYHRKPNLVVLTCAAGADVDVHFIQMLKQKYPGMGVVLWTDVVDRRVHETLLSAGAAAVIQKTVEFDRNLDSCGQMLQHLS